MKKFLGLFAVTAVALSMSSSATLATLIYNETFTYPNGNLVGNDSWAAHSGAGSVPVQVSSNAIILSQGSGSREDVNKPFTAIGAGTKIYAAFDISIANNTASDYFASFLQGTSTFRSRIYTVAPTAGGDYTVGIGWASGAALNATWAADLSFGSTYRIVTSYDFDSGNQQIWVSPSLESDTNLSGSSGSVSGLAVAAFAFRQGTATTSTQTIDNLCVGTTFSDALTCGVPEPTTLTLLAFGAMALIRRRR